MMPQQGVFMHIAALILADGQNPLLNSSTPASLHSVLGDPSLLWVLNALPGNTSLAIIADGGDENIRKAIETWRKRDLLPCSVVCTDTPAAEIEKTGSERVIVLFGDMPLITAKTVNTLAEQADRNLDPQAALQRIQRAATSSLETTRIERRQDLAIVQAAAREGINEAWMETGVTILDPASTFISPRVKLAADVVLESQVRLEGATQIARGTSIAQGAIVRDCLIGEGVEIKAYTVAQEARIGSRAIIGPFARLREQTVLEERVHIGNFVETKKTTLKTGAKANHLTYLGDSEVGEGTNVGAGVITCNYDGFHKFRTVIGKNVFVGSDCQLIAPITIGDGVTIAAGTTLTQDVPADGLAINRAPLVIKEGGGARLREKLRAQVG